MTDNQVGNIMKLLHCSAAEALDVIVQDKAIDQGKRVEFDLDPATEKMAKKFANAGVRKNPVIYNFNTKDKKRKENPTKAAIIAELAIFLQEDSEHDYKNVEVTNKERQITLNLGSNSFELTLVQKRPSKK